MQLKYFRDRIKVSYLKKKVVNIILEKRGRLIIMLLLSLEGRKQNISSKSKFSLFSDGIGKLLIPGEERNCREIILQREPGVCAVPVFGLSHSCNNGNVSSDPDFQQGGNVMGRAQRGESFCSLDLRMLFQGLITDSVFL